MHVCKLILHEMMNRKFYKRLGTITGLPVGVPEHPPQQSPTLGLGGTLF